MSTLTKLVSCVLVALAIGGCASVEDRTGRPCERCSRGYLPVDSDRNDRHAVCMVNNDVANCDKIPAGCSECARIQRRDLDAR